MVKNSYDNELYLKYCSPKLESDALVSVVKWSPDGQYLGIIQCVDFLILDKNGNIKTYDSWPCEYTLEDLDWSPDGMRIILTATVNESYGYDDDDEESETTSIILMRRNGRVIEEIEDIYQKIYVPDNYERIPFTKVQWSPDGSRILLYSDSAFIIFDRNLNEEFTILDVEKELELYSIDLMMWDPTGSNIGILGEKTLLVINNEGELLWQYGISFTERGNFYKSIAWSPDGNKLAVSHGPIKINNVRDSYKDEQEYGYIHIFSVNNGKRVKIIEYPIGEIGYTYVRDSVKLVWDPKDQIILVAAGNMLHAYSPKGRLYWSVEELAQPLSNIIWNEEDDRIYASTKNYLYVFSRKGEILWSTRVKELNEIYSISVSPEGNIAVGGGRGKLLCFSPNY